MSSDLDAVRRARYFPIRHHSPRAATAVHAFLTETAPELVLIEAPEDAVSLIDVLVDGETEPPVAILGYRTSGEPGSSLWPFASYSPEYAALRWAHERGVPAAFIDIPTGCSLGGVSGEPEEEELEAPEDVRSVHELYEACAAERGYRSFEEFWEASFEAPRYRPDELRDALLAFAELSRAGGGDPLHLARDAFMASRVAKEIENGTAPEAIGVVLGAAHAAALVNGDVDLERLATLPEEVPTAVTVIPFSFPRLAEQTGYGAGNRAPYYYQRAFDASCDYRRAGLEVLIDFAEELRLRGHTASMADTIEAHRLAIGLAEMRDKAEPGLDELREAAIATMGRGEDALAELLWPSVIGHKLGKVAARVGRNSLQEEFWREVRERKLPQHDAPESFSLQLNNETEVATSIFLHRLRVSDVPYAAYLGSQRFGAGGGTEEAPGGFEALSRTRETWEAQWSPATDASLVEKIALGDTLEQVVTRMLRSRLDEVGTTGEAADVLLESVVASAPQTVNEALRASERLAASDEDVPSLAHACRALSGLVSYGTSRSLSKVGDEALRALCVRTFERAILRVAPSCVGDDEAVAPVVEALRALHEVALAQPLVDENDWFRAAREVVDSYSVNPLTSGLCAGLLYLAQVVSDDDVLALIEQRLSDVGDPERAATFLEGFLRVNATVIVKSRAIVEALDRFLTSIPAERFRDTAPLLRRAFSVLGPTERRYLLENVIVLRNVSDRAQAAKEVLGEQDKEKLKEMSGELSDAVDELDDLL